MHTEVRQIPHFERAYDAQETYKRKSEMPHIAASDLKRGDIVLVEVFVTRWIPKEEDSDLHVGTSYGRKGSSTKGKAPKKEWKRWNVQFTLDAVSLLYQGSQFYVEETKADEDVEM